MKSPNVWIGLGEYGKVAVEQMADRLSVLQLFGAAHGTEQPVLVHLACTNGPTAIEPRYIEATLTGDVSDLVKQVHGRLSPDLRKGNLNGDGYVFVVCHERELRQIGGIDAPEHLLWSLPGEFQFGSQFLVLIVAVERSKDQTAPSDRVAHVAHCLSQIDSAMHTALEKKESGSSRLVLLNPTGLLDWSDLLQPSPSRDAIVLLFDLLTSLDVDPPSDPGLHQLLIRQAQVSDGLAECTSFGIGAFGVDLGPAVTRATLELRDQLKRTLSHQSSSSGPPKPELPSMDIPTPDIPTSIDPLDFKFVPGYFEGSGPAIARLNREAARLDTVVPEWWERETQSDPLKSAMSRDRAGAALDESLRWLDVLIRRLWVDERRSAGQIAEVLKSAVEQIGGDSVAAGLMHLPLPPAPPSFAAQIEKLRSILQRRPDPASVVLLIGAVALAMLLALWGAATWLGQELSNASILASTPAREIIAVAGAALVVALCIQQWIDRPFHAAKNATDQASAQAKQARNTVQQFRLGFANHVHTVLCGEVRARLRRELGLVEQIFKNVAEKTSEGFHETRLVDPSHNTKCMFEDLTEELAEDLVPDIEPVSARFRERFIPGPLRTVAAYGQRSGGHAVEIEPHLLLNQLEEFARRMVFENVLVQPIARFDRVKLDDVHLRVGDGQEFLEVYLPKGATANVKAGTECRDVLRRNDRCYVLRVAANRLIAQAVRER